MSRRQSNARSDVDKELLDLCDSIDRSRKRHLSVGLLRGDLVHDRLAQQESSASPLLKKHRAVTPKKTPPNSASPDDLPAPPADPEMAMTMADFKAYMEENSTKRFDGLEGTIAGIRSTVNKVEATVSSNSAKIDKHERQISDIKAEMNDLKARAATAPVSSAPPAASWAQIAASPQDDRDYDVARRSLRLWPVLGITREDLAHAVGVFLGQNLGLQNQLSMSTLESVSRPDIPSGPGVSNEVLVTFNAVSVRDQVMGTASKLAPFVDANGKPTAGMRIQIPRRLQTDFRILFKYGQTLRTRHGEGTRRHVKFEDTTRSLYLNVKLPGDEQWSRVSTELASRGLRAREVANDGVLEKRLDITGTARPRSSSTSAPPNPIRPSAWTARRSDSVSS